MRGKWTEIEGDVLGAFAPSIIVHGCNCKGVMGGGVALAVRSKYPAAYQAYMRTHCTPIDDSRSGLRLGSIIPVEVEPNKWIVNAMTQDDFGTNKRQVNYEAMYSCFEGVNKFAREILAERSIIPEIAFPMIGAGLAGGNWEIIKTIIDQTLDATFDRKYFVFIPR